MRCTIASTIITAPSTINPKSIAPKLIKLPLTPNKLIKLTANNNANGITEATINPALQFPIKSTKIKITINAPSMRFVLTVEIALFTNLDRSRYDSIIIPSGRFFSI